MKLTLKPEPLNGAWTIYDAKKRTASRLEFEKSELHGTATWWYPDGQRRRQVQYQHGRPTGQWQEWDAQGNLTKQIQCVDGRPLRTFQQWHAPGQPSCEGAFLLPGETTLTSFDWWKAAMQIDPARAAVKMGTQTLRFLAQQSEKAGQPVDPMVLLHAGIQLVKDIAGIANDTGLLPDSQIEPFLQQEIRRLERWVDSLA